MTRIPIVFLTFATLVPFLGCNSSTPSSQPAATTATPASQPAPSVSDAAKAEDARLKREVADKRRKSKSADLDKTNAYRNYVP